MQKNVASQKWIVFAFDETDNTPKPGDANQITAKISKDGAAGGGNIADTNPTELEDGYYVFDIAQGESNADLLALLPESSTPDIQVIGVPGAVYTMPVGFPDNIMVGTDGANTTTPPTVTEIQTEMEEDGASILDAIRDLLPGTTIAAANDIPAMVGTNNALLAASVNIADGAIKSDLTHIHGTALSETAGQLAAAFKKLFDVAIPLLVASDVMVGTNGANTTVPDAAGTAASLHGTTNGKVDAVQSDVTNIKNKTDSLNFTGTDVKATLDGEEVVTNSASRTASKAGAADVAGAEVDVTAIHGSPLAEDSAANLADNFSAFYNNGDSAPTLQTVDDVGGGVSPVALATLVKAVITPDNVFTLDSGSTVDNYYKEMVVSIIDKSTGEINSRRISAYSGATRQITVDADFEIPIEDGVGDEDTVIIWSNAYSPAAGTAAAGAIATAVWAALRAANNDPGSMGQIQGVHGWCGT